MIRQLLFNTDLRSMLIYCPWVMFWWALVAGLLLKPPLLRRVTRQPWVKCTIAGIAMALTTTLLVVRYPYAALVTVVPVLLALSRVCSDCRAATIVIIPAAALAAAGLEAVAMRLVFGRWPGKGGLGLLCLANLLCLSFAVYGGVVYSEAHPLEG